VDGVLGADGDEWLADGVVEDCVNSIKYDGYIKKHQKQLQEQAALDDLEIPGELAYADVGALSHEAREKLARMRPRTLGQASRIDGVRAGDLAVLSVMVRRSSGAGVQSTEGEP
jgi:tRNA uridine 5-carboxymethylaminomethyl modification enzyme